MNITLNGKKITTKAMTVSELVAEQGMAGKPVIVERNQTALVASVHATIQLEEGDVIEVFVLGAGG